MDHISAGILRTLAFHASWGYAPTRLQLILSLDAGTDQTGFGIYNAEKVQSCLDDAIGQGTVVEVGGRVSLANFADAITEGKKSEDYFPRKLRRARQATAYLRRIPGVRAVCLCNTVALGQSKDEGDLDFFVITQAGTIWRTRFFSALPFKLFGLRPGKKVVDPVCLSFFVSDAALDLSGLSLAGDDPYFRHWFLSLLPLYDDGVLSDLWKANAALLARHPLAKAWIALDHPCAPSLAESRTNNAVTVKTARPEKFWRSLQERAFPPEIKSLANSDTRVVVTDDVLKFHVTDQRAKFRERYGGICRDLGVCP